MINGYYTVKEVSDKLGVGAEAVRRYIREDKLAAQKVKSKGMQKVWGVHPDDLDKFRKS